MEELLQGQRKLTLDKELEDWVQGTIHSSNEVSHTPLHRYLRVLFSDTRSRSLSFYIEQEQSRNVKIGRKGGATTKNGRSS